MSGAGLIALVLGTGLTAVGRGQGQTQEGQAPEGNPGANAPVSARAVAPVTAQNLPNPAIGRLNPTGRDIALTVPLKDDATYLGDLPLTITARDTLTFPADRMFQLLGLVLNPSALEALRNSVGTKPVLEPGDLLPAGVRVRYDPQTLEVRLDIPAEKRATRSLTVAPLDQRTIGTIAPPEAHSAYLNLRSSFDVVEQGAATGIQNPNFLLDGAIRFAPFVLESDAIWTPDALGSKFQRQGSRLVYDDLSNMIRITMGDLKTTSRGFQSTPDMAGISIFRSYSVLNPQQIVRPRGDQTFTLERNSSVEVYVNGQQMRRLQLAPGTYNLRDFPFTQGANDIRLNILDDAGRSVSYNFNVFIDQTQLAKGLSEFGVYMGASSPLGPNGPQYSNEWMFSGYYRRGVTDYLTLGVNFQSDKAIQMGGAEMLWGTSIGTFGLSAAFSRANGYGEGSAFRATFQRLIQTGSGAAADTLDVFVERRTERFTPVSFFLATNPYEAEAGIGYTHSFNSRFYGGVDARYSAGRGAVPDVHNYRLTAGWRITNQATLSAEARYQDDVRGKVYSGFLSLTMRLGRYSSLRTEFDSRDNQARVSYQTLHGTGVNSYNVSADVSRSDQGAQSSFNFNYFTNRAELGVSHYGDFTNDFGTSIDQRTNFRLGTSIAFAGDAVAIGRPIYDSFAIVKPNARLHGADVVVEPSPFGHTADTGALGTAIMPNLASYAERTVAVDVPNAPAGTDIGQGTFRLSPSYRSGYRLIVGSDYAVTLMGTMVDADGEPVSLAAGTAVELAHPEKPPLTVFTNRQGRFGLSGLAPGHWHVEMSDAKATRYDIEIPANAEGIVRMDKLAPGQQPTVKEGK
ncbi:MAG: fimbrial biogenesis outer membrane usher protein [Sphingomonadales bacterium]|nr:fimbrial biogenesis outer membrane usher protein [Sphingomonadales bacterium]MDE2169581.1 fimbrial biogenesis outer membrane usher protein [Sphingomonadales bacterium]